MFIMKTILLLLACFTISILEADSEECVPKEFTDFKPELLQGTWYLYCVSPNLFTQLINVSDVLQLDGNTYVGDVTLTLYSKNVSETHDLTIQIEGTTLDSRFKNLGQFDSPYKIYATDYDNYLIKRGHPNVTAPEDLYLVFFRKRCPVGSTAKKAKQAILDVCWDSVEFHVDPSLITQCH